MKLGHLGAVMISLASFVPIWLYGCGSTYHLYIYFRRTQLLIVKGTIGSLWQNFKRYVCLYFVNILQNSNHSLWVVDI